MCASSPGVGYGRWLLWRQAEGKLCVLVAIVFVRQGRTMLSVSQGPQAVMFGWCYCVLLVCEDSGHRQSCSGLECVMPIVLDLKFVCVSA